MKIIRIVGLMVMCVCALFMMSPPSSAVVVTLTDLASTADFAINTGSGDSFYDWIVDGEDELALEWFYVSIKTGSDWSTPQALGGGSYTYSTHTTTADSLDVDYNLGGGASIKLEFDLTGSSAGVKKSDIDESVRITAGTSQLDIRVYEYSHFQLGGTTPDDYGLLRPSTPGPQIADVADAAWRLSETVATPRPKFYEVGDATTVFSHVGTQALDGSLGVYGPGDVAWAFGWEFTIAAGATESVISKDKHLRPDDTLLIPEPLTMLGMFLGLGGVGAYIRRRRMM